jgi:hypothetical protein
VAPQNLQIYQLSQLMIALDPAALQRDHEELSKLLDSVGTAMDPIGRAQSFVAPIVAAVQKKFAASHAAGVEVSDAEVAAEFVTASGNAMATTANAIAKRKSGE